jgi:hypothetical protein
MLSGAQACCTSVGLRWKHNFPHALKIALGTLVSSLYPRKEEGEILRTKE